MTPVGKCTARVRIGDAGFVGTFIVLPQCCRDLIIGMYFLREHDAVINIRQGFVSFSANKTAPKSTGNRRAHLRIVDDDISLPPRSSILVAVKCGDPLSSDGVAEVMRPLLLDGGIAIARGLGTLARGEAEVLLTNFANERRRIAKGTAVAALE